MELDKEKEIRQTNIRLEILEREEKELNKKMLKMQKMLAELKKQKGNAFSFLEFLGAPSKKAKRREKTKQGYDYEKELNKEYKTIEGTKFESMVIDVIPKYCRKKMDLLYKMAFKVVDRTKFRKKLVLHDIYGVEDTDFSDDINRVINSVISEHRRDKETIKNIVTKQIKKTLKPILLNKYGIEITALTDLQLVPSIDKFVFEDYEED